MTTEPDTIATALYVRTGDLLSTVLRQPLPDHAGRLGAFLTFMAKFLAQGGRHHIRQGCDVVIVAMRLIC